MAEYKFFKDREGKNNVGVIYKESTWIPNEPSNRYWIEYLKWAETNTTEAAD